MTDITFSVRLPEETKSLLDALSKSTKRSKNFLAREAITNFVQSQSDIVEGILQSIADVKEGRVIGHDEVKKKSRAIIAAAHERANRKT